MIDRGTDGRIKLLIELRVCTWKKVGNCRLKHTHHSNCVESFLKWISAALDLTHARPTSFDVCLWFDLAHDLNQESVWLKNKAGYTVISSRCWWAGAVMQVGRGSMWVVGAVLRLSRSCDGQKCVFSTHWGYVISYRMIIFVDCEGGLAVAVKFRPVPGGRPHCGCVTWQTGNVSPVGGKSEWTKMLLSCSRGAEALHLENKEYWLQLCKHH